MTDETESGLVYPYGEADLKRRITGEILRLVEKSERQMPDDEMVALIERVFSAVRAKHYDRIGAGRPIDVAAEVRKFRVE